MINDILQNKIENSYKVLKLAAEMSTTYYEKPLILTYSGGKDSDVLAQLARECLKPSEFEVFNSHTTVDAPETVYYIRERFAEWEQEGIKCTIHYPHYKDGRPMSMWSLIVDKQMPPTRIQRYCCKHLKEVTTPNRFIATGVRSAESINRKGRDVFATRAGKKNDAYYYYYEHVEEVFRESLEKTEGDVKNESPWDCTFIQLAKKNKDLICNPIYDWTDADVWDFIRTRGMNYNPLYDQGFSRVGCIGCPMSTNQIRDFNRYPKYKAMYIKAFQRMVDKRKAEGKTDIKRNFWSDGESVYRWWTKDYGEAPGQMSIFDMEEK